MDYSDIESGEDNYYSDNGADDDYEFAEETLYKDSTSNRSQLGYVVLKEEDIRSHQKDDIEQVSTVLSLSQPEAIVLLLYYRWIVSKVQEEWFTDEERVRKLVGLMKEPVVIDVANGKKVKTVCGICFESFTQRSILKVSCGHPYCKTCWTKYITTNIKDGPGCLRVNCPEPSCSAAVGQDMIDKVTKKKDKKKYDTFFLRSYVEEGGNKIKWCPSPGCKYAIEFGTESESGSSFDVSCLCSYNFCWNCCEDAHRPVDCGTVSKWIFKNNDEAENTNWILANSKPCPKCKRPIEKNLGCMHMTCYSPCKHQFCWTCLRAWSNGHSGCNKYTSSDIVKAEDKRMKAKTLLDRYAHYYERWANNQSSRLKAKKDLEKLQSVQFKELSERLALPETQLQFTVEAWLQIIECRRVLKWTYAYGYYLPEHEGAKKQLFEYLQGEAETGLERLHHCAETELNQFVSETGAPPPNSFGDFRVKLTGLTKVTKTYFENLVKALENGLADVEAHHDIESTTTNTITKRQKVGNKDKCVN